MEHLADIPWPEIIREASATPLGIIALMTIGLSIIAIIMAVRERRAWPNLIAIILIALAIVLGTIAVQPIAAEEVERINRLEEERDYRVRIETQTNQCKEQVVFKSGYCRAYDKSGLNSSPSANCDIDVNADGGYFFTGEAVEVVSEYYRNIAGASAGQAVRPRRVEGQAHVTRYSGRIGCTNARGTGRTCVAEATVRVPSYPMACLEYIEALKS